LRVLVKLPHDDVHSVFHVAIKPLHADLGPAHIVVKSSSFFSSLEKHLWDLTLAMPIFPRVVSASDVMASFLRFLVSSSSSLSVLGCCECDCWWGAFGGSVPVTSAGDSVVWGAVGAVAVMEVVLFVTKYSFVS